MEKKPFVSLDEPEGGETPVKEGEEEKKGEEEVTE